MNQTLILNAIIVLFVVLLGVELKDPLIILGLFFLQPLPFELAANEQRIRAAKLNLDLDEDQGGEGDKDEEREPAIGFTAAIH